ncbi:hypothetical protein BU16DRAFT_565232 [Lophium mytilinum]|uniref:Apple domain-containing protein n=1 Tax=Lophium mytilinum TaxID=390894 RepID=A0A6A6QIP9_9PEZI|nr:hypothetical protein BU16DRAFT_565232 [Lophium mytilinum]
MEGLGSQCYGFRESREPVEDLRQSRGSQRREPLDESHRRWESSRAFYQQALIVFSEDSGLHNYKPSKPSIDAPQVYSVAGLEYNEQSPPPFDECDIPVEKRILGLRKTTFWLLLTLALVVFGAAMGGGIHLPPPPTVTATRIPITITITNIFLCTRHLQTPRTLHYSPNRHLLPAASHAFIEHLLLHDTDGACAFRCTNGTSMSGYGVIAAIVTYSLQDCMDACSSMNHLTRQTLCVEFTIGADLGYAITHLQPAADCWLVASSTSSGGCEKCASGRLCKDEVGCEEVF